MVVAVVVAVAAVASALGPRGGLALKFLEIISPLAGGGCCWRGWSVRGWRLVVGWWLLLAWVVVVFFSAAGRHGVLRGGAGARGAMACCAVARARGGGLCGGTGARWWRPVTHKSGSEWKQAV